MPQPNPYDHLSDEDLERREERYRGMFWENRRLRDRYDDMTELSLNEMRDVQAERHRRATLAG